MHIYIIMYTYIYIYHTLHTSPRCKLIATAHAWVSSFCWKIFYNRLLVLGLILQWITRYWNIKCSVVFLSSTLPTSLFKDNSCFNMFLFTILLQNKCSNKMRKMLVVLRSAIKVLLKRYCVLLKRFHHDGHVFIS